MPIKSTPLKERFETKFLRTDGCWEWTASLTLHGYGQIRVGSLTDGSRTMTKAHRVSWMLYRGAIPDDLSVLHRCDNRRCVNPAHLFLGTNAENTADMVAKGRGAHGERHGNAKLTDAQVIEIRALAGAMYQREIAKQFGVKQQAVSRILAGLSRAEPDDTIARECAEQGIVLTDPDPELAAYQQRYRANERKVA